MPEFNFKVGLGIPPPSREIFLKGVGIQAIKEKLLRVKDFDVEEPDMTSYLGTPVFDPVRIVGGNYFALDDLSKTNPIPYPDDSGAELIIPTVIIEVSQTKNIITTAIQGKNGTVKEFVSDGDFAITLTGLIVGENIAGEVKDLGNVYPIVDIKRLVTVCKVPDSITITSTFLNDVFGINDVTITDYNVPQLEGTRDMQPFTINMLSDSPIELDELSPSEFR